jgi:ABC-2 type transport system ATP-binding protein
MALAKRPELLVLDEPIASLDPLARREFLDALTDYIAAYKVSVLMSSHLVSDLERICDYLIVLGSSRVLTAGEVSELLASHRAVAGPGTDPASLEDIVVACLGKRSGTAVSPGSGEEADR